jgi:hypothetical protein
MGRIIAAWMAAMATIIHDLDAKYVMGLATADGATSFSRSLPRLMTLWHQERYGC